MLSVASTFFSLFYQLNNVFRTLRCTFRKKNWFFKSPRLVQHFKNYFFEKFLHSNAERRGRNRNRTQSKRIAAFSESTFNAQCKELPIKSNNKIQIVYQLKAPDIRIYLRINDDKTHCQTQRVMNKLNQKLISNKYQIFKQTYICIWRISIGA